MRHTKIIATVGPACDSEEMIARLIAVGVDIFRLNFSHGTHESHLGVIQRIRAASARAKREVAVLQDLSGPKIRTGRLEGGVALTLNAGDRLKIATGDFVGGPGRISTAFAGLAQNVRPGDCLLVADGTVELKVDATDGVEMQTTVVEGGKIGEHKGINAPGVPLPASAITPKDIDDLTFGLASGVDLVAVSFVQTAEDLRRARSAMAAQGGAHIPLVAKLERPQAIEHLDEILRECDAVMIARGDLGLEMPLESVPRAQQTITRSARKRGIPVILATQVLESMTTGARPTRAEVSDAAYAVVAGVDGIMLAGETAVGAYAARAVQTLDAIIQNVEAMPAPEETLRRRKHNDDRHHGEALCEAAVTLANRGNAQAIVAVTRAGWAARRLSVLRPRAPILAATDAVQARRLLLYWGIVPVAIEPGEEVHAHSAGKMLGPRLVARGLVAPGSDVVLVSISTDVTRVNSNYVKLQRI
jgi:pyruvate kinase